MALVISHPPASRLSLSEVLHDTTLNLCHNQTGSVGREVKRVLPCFVCMCEEACVGEYQLTPPSLRFDKQESMFTLRVR